MRSLLPFFVCLTLLVQGYQATAQEPSDPPQDADESNLWTREGVDWPTFLGVDRTGKSSETGLNFDWDNQLPPVVWQKRFGESYSMGVVSKGRFFHLERVKDPENEGDLERAVCLNAETGEQLWQTAWPTDYRDTYGFDGGPRCSPIVDGDRLYAFGVQGILYCMNVSNGDTIWKVDTNEKFGVIQNFFGVGSSPLVFQDLLIVMIGGSPAESADVPSSQLDRVKPNGSAIVAFDKMTGEVRYQTIDDLASYASPVVADLNGSMTGLAFSRSGLYSFDPLTGEQGFEFPYRARKFESVNASTPVVVDSKILLTESYGLGGVLLELKDGQPQKVWSDDGIRDASLACHWNTPVVVGDYAYASSGEKQSTAMLQCIRLSDGKVMWSQPRLTRSSLTLAEGHLFVATESGRLLVVRATHEEYDLVAEYPKESLPMRYPCWGAPIVSHGYLYVRDKSNVFCIDLQK